MDESSPRGCREEGWRGHCSPPGWISQRGSLEEARGEVRVRRRAGVSIGVGSFASDQSHRLRQDAYANSAVEPMTLF